MTILPHQCDISTLGCGASCGIAATVRCDKKATRAIVSNLAQRQAIGASGDLGEHQPAIGASGDLGEHQPAIGASGDLEGRLALCQI